MGKKSGVMSWGRKRVLAAIILAMAGGAAAAAAGTASVGTASGLPVPRFVSLKSDRVNVRAGPTKDHEVVWVFTRAGLPVEITAEFENWRRVRDWEGAEGWVYHSLLSGRRTGLVTTKSKDGLVPLYEKPDLESAVIARLQSGVVGAVKECAQGFCRFAGDKFDGYIVQARLFGVYPNEKVQ
jgi:SH3-like domain-containing protein